MGDLCCEDIVSYEIKGEKLYGKVMSVKRKRVSVLDFESFGEITLRIEDVSVIPPFILDYDQIRSLCRYEIKWSELTKDADPNGYILFEKPYVLTVQDVYAALGNIVNSRDSNETVCSEWYDPLMGYIDSYELNIDYETAPSSVRTVPGVPNRADLLDDIFEVHLRPLLSSKARPFYETADTITALIDEFLGDEKRPIAERKFTKEDKENFIGIWSHAAMINSAESDIVEAYRNFVYELSSEMNVTALEAKAYGSYVGNAAFKCNWRTAQECLIILFSLTGDPKYANSLGYIYYDGRCNRDVPQYGKALKYFSVAAAAGDVEARYKMFDLYYNGHGIAKNPEIAYRIISSLYNELYVKFRGGSFNNKFGDVALRMGRCFEDGIEPCRDLRRAQRYYLQAEFALRNRNKYIFYGDKKVRRLALEALNRMSPVKKLSETEPDELLSGYLESGRRIIMKIKPLGDRLCRLTFSLAPVRNELGCDDNMLKMFITDPETGFCGFLESVSLTVENALIKSADIGEPIVFDSYDDSHYYLGDKLTARISGTYHFKPPAEKKKRLVATLRYDSSQIVSDYLLEDENIKAGDRVVVRAYDSEAELTVVNVEEKAETDLPYTIKWYDKIIRKV